MKISKSSSRRALITGLTPVSILLGLSSCTGQQAPKAKPNILFIAVDDLRPELNCYGRSHIVSPNIDRLAAEGVLFERAYVQQAICMASRASLLTGYRNNQYRIFNNEAVQKIIPGALTMNKFFENNGYDVYGVGKLYHHTEDHREQFGEGWFDSHAGYKGLGRGYLLEESFIDSDEGKGLPWECADVEDNEYMDGYYGEWVSKKLGELKDNDKPFFLGVGFHKPHLPFNAPKKYWDLYDHENLVRTKFPNLPVNAASFSHCGGGEVLSYATMPKHHSQLSEESVKNLIHGYYACVSFVDAQVGKILDALEANGLKENTIIVFWGDHGWKLQDHGCWNKHTTFEIDNRIPFIVSAPGMKKNAVSYSLTESLDIYPTLVDLCGFELPGHLQGKSIVPLLKDADARVHDAVCSIFPKRDREVLGYSVRTDKYRYTEFIELSTGNILEKELYDLSKSKQELENVVGEAQFQKELPYLSGLVQQYRTLENVK